jgi:hypothetical protein
VNTSAHPASPLCGHGYSRAELIKDLRTSRPRDLGLDATASHVREKLMVFANGEHQTYVSVSTLAAAIGRSEKTVRRALSRLYAAGEVTPRIEVTAWGRRNVYRLSKLAGSPSDDPRSDASPKGGTVRPSLAHGQNDPMGRDTVTRPPPDKTLLSDRDHLNDPPPPPRLVVGSDSSDTEMRVLARWQDAKLPPVDALSARVTLRRRLADGLSEEELCDAVDGARARSDGEGWPGVVCAFAVVMACGEYVRAYAQRGHDARAARERREQAEHARRVQARADERACRITARGRGFAEVIALAAAGRYESASRLAFELEEPRAGPDSVHRSGPDVSREGCTLRSDLTTKTGGKDVESALPSKPLTPRAREP